MQALVERGPRRTLRGADDRARHRAAGDAGRAHEERIALAGTANLTRGGLLDFQGSLRPILEALEEEVILLKLFGEVEPSTTRVLIGDENEIDDLRADLGGQHRLRPGHHRRRRARRARARPGWTTPAPSPRCGPWHATSATCWHRTDRTIAAIADDMRT